MSCGCVGVWQRSYREEIPPGLCEQERPKYRGGIWTSIGVGAEFQSMGDALIKEEE